MNLFISNKTKKYAFLTAVIMLFTFTGFALLQAREMIDTMPEYKSETIKLPEPVQGSNTSIEEALLKRRSIRSYKDSSLTLAEVSQLLWAAQGITSPRGSGQLHPQGRSIRLKFMLLQGMWMTSRMEFTGTTLISMS